MNTIRKSLKQAIAGSGLSDKRLGELSGVNRLSIGRFMQDRTSLSLEQAEMLAKFFGLELKPARGKAKG